MKNLKKIMAGLISLGMISTIGISTLVSAEETQKTFYTGDVNLDGKVNTLDLLTLKKMLLGLTDLQEMYIDGDTLKKVETKGEDVTIQATQYTVDVENSTIHVTGIGDTTQVHDLTLKVTDNTTFSGNFSSLEEVAKKLEQIKGLCIDITYNSLTKEISHVAQISVVPSTVETIQTHEYTVDVENNLITAKISGTYEYITIKVTDDTVFDSDIINLEGLSKLENMYDKDISITYHNNTQEAIEVNRIIITCVEPIPLSTVTSAQDNLTIDIDTENSQIKLTGTGDNANFSDTLSITYNTEITRNGETLTLEELAKIDSYQYIGVAVEYNLDTKEVTKLSLMDINGNDTNTVKTKTIQVCSATDYIIQSIDDNSITIYNQYTKENIILTTDDNTMIAGEDSLENFYQYAMQPDKYQITITYNINTNIITNIYLLAIPEPNITTPGIQ